tara:strand:+ start:178 stop:555 length:378 start_codon:yes stop_codon:yes gene_type:complete
VRLAGDCTCDNPEVFQTIWKHLKTDGVPDQAANQMAAEMLTHGEDFESSVAKYQQYEDNYKSKGFNEHAAQAMAVEALEGRQEEPRESMRYAGEKGEPIASVSFEVPDRNTMSDNHAFGMRMLGR